MSIDFSYTEFKKKLTHDWEKEVTSIFRALDTLCEGAISRQDAIHALELIGINGEPLFHPSKKMISIQLFIDTVKSERSKNSSDSQTRWTYIFHLIAGSKSNSITKEKIQQFFADFGHTPNLRYCEDFIDEFDRLNLEKTEISLDDWLGFCRIHRVPF